jgi:hypothetical protein
MITDIWCGDIRFYIKGGRIPILTFQYRNKTQGILSFEGSCNEHYLYVWYDEGEFPKFFNTIINPYNSGESRLQVVGVDDV